LEGLMITVNRPCNWLVCRIADGCSMLFDRSPGPLPTREQEIVAQVIRRKLNN
jgi:hypothetical protein